MSRKILPPAEAIAETNPPKLDPIPDTVGETIQPEGVIPQPPMAEVKSLSVRIPEGALPLPVYGSTPQGGKRYRASGVGRHYFPDGRYFDVTAPVFAVSGEEDIKLLDYAAALNPTSIFVLE